MVVYTTALAAIFRIAQLLSFYAIMTRCQKGNTSLLQIAAERDVLRQEIEFNHQGVLKIALSSTDAKFNIRSGIWKKKG